MEPPDAVHTPGRFVVNVTLTPVPTIGSIGAIVCGTSAGAKKGVVSIPTEGAPPGANVSCMCYACGTSVTMNGSHPAAVARSWIVVPFRSAALRVIA